MYAAMGILAALFALEKTGRGQFLDMALFDSQLTWLANIGSNFLNAGVSPERWGNAHPSIVPYDVFRGSDARHFVVGVGTEPLWKKFVILMGLDATIGVDPRFQTNASRTKHRDLLIPEVQKLFAARTSNEWLELLARAEIPAAPINTVEEALNDTQTKARRLIVQLEHPVLGSVRSIANPIQFSETPVSYRLPPPLLGEHSAAILHDLGYSESEIAMARHEGAV
jgi:crotonobetainyl-CoA:carnitine CoA-transferase CaiB-like acyl-CoA transferase